MARKIALSEKKSVMKVYIVYIFTFIYIYIYIYIYTHTHIHTHTHKLESRFLGEISITSDMQMTPPL